MHLKFKIIARYNTERFCNRLKRLVSLSNFRVPIPEGYFPKLDSLIASRSSPGRISGASLLDLNREAEQLTMDISVLERWRQSCIDAITRGSIVNASGTSVSLGIDLLGNMLEASMLAPNPRLYGNLHNFGHVFISYCHDPDNRHLESFGVMGDTATAMRDPVFFRWHGFINDLFLLHKATLPPYTTEQLTFPGIVVSAIQIQSDGDESPNVFNTFWQQSDLNLSRGIDFAPRGNLFAR